MLGQVGEAYGVQVVRLCSRDIDLPDDRAIDQLGEVSFEWPRYASGWSLPELIALIEQFALINALCDGCAFGLVSMDNLPLLKP